MTAAPTKASWKDLYNTSLGFILREEGGGPTPFRLEKTARGYESMSFEVLDAKKFAARRYVVWKTVTGSALALALSLHITSHAKVREYAAAFRRMVDSAELKGERPSARNSRDGKGTSGSSTGLA